MKQDAISKINKMGRIGAVITVIAKIVTIVGLIFLFALTIFFAVIPKDFITIKADGRAFVNINFAPFDETLTDEEVEEGRKEAEGILEQEEAGDFEYGIKAIDITNDGVYVDLTGKTADFSLHSLVWVMLAAFLYLSMTLVTLFFIGFLCKAFRDCESPFEENVIKKMRILAYSLIPWALFSTMSTSVTRAVFTDSFRLDSIGVDMKMVMTVLIILALAYIFQYGAVLQQESDETL